MPDSTTSIRHESFVADADLNQVKGAKIHMSQQIHTMLKKKIGNTVHSFPLAMPSTPLLVVRRGEQPTILGFQ